MLTGLWQLSPIAGNVSPLDGGSNIVPSLLEQSFNPSLRPENAVQFGLAAGVTPGQRAKRGSNKVPSPPPSPPPCCRNDNVFPVQQHSFIGKYLPGEMGMFELDGLRRSLTQVDDVGLLRECEL